MACPTCPTCPRAFRVGVPSRPRARVTKFLVCPRAFDVGVPSCPQIFGVPWCEMFRTLLREVNFDMLFESLKLSDPFFLNFIRKNQSRGFEVKKLKHG